MFRTGQVLKVKVELSPEAIGFGRATILEMHTNRMYLQLKTAKGEKRMLPKGTRVWFVSDGVSHPFNGLWSTTIVNSKRIGGQMAMECSRPKFESLEQRRRYKRVMITSPVRLRGDKLKDFLDCKTRNISRSGIGIEVSEDRSEEFSINHNIDLTIESPLGEIAVTARIVQCKFNWLVNKTDIGLEIIEIADHGASILDALLVSVGGKPRQAPEGKEAQNRAPAEIGALSNWIKSSKDSVAFVRGKEGGEGYDENADEETQEQGQE